MVSEDGEKNQPLLSRPSDDESLSHLNDDHLDLAPAQLPAPFRSKLSCLLCVLFLSTSFFAGIFAGHFLPHRSILVEPAEMHDKPQTIHTVFHWHTPFSNDVKPISSPLWAGLFPTGLVSVDRDWAKDQRLPASREDPANASSMVYFVAGFHQLHCLTVIRASLYHYKESANQTVPWKHVTHCLDSLRQLVQCKADGALLYTEDANVFGDGQVHKCQDWGALSRWAADHAFEQEL